MNWFLFWLLLHILAAIAGLGPTFVFPVLGSLTEKNPAAAHFSAELSHKMEAGLIIPIALTLLVSGSGLIITANINLTKTPYLEVAIILYLIAMAIVFLNQLPTTMKLIEATAGGPPPGAPPGPPPPHIQALVNRAKTGGMILTGLLVAIIILMVIKPGGITTGPIFG